MNMSARIAEPGYGLRHDPLAWVQQDPSVSAAMVRRDIVGAPRSADAALLRARIDEILAEQRDDGALGEGHRETGGRLLELLRLGLAPDRPEVAAAAEAVLRQRRAEGNQGEWLEQHGILSYAPIQALCLAGVECDELRFSLRWLAEHPEAYLGYDKGCPWTPAPMLEALWAGRHLEDTAAAFERGLLWLRDSLSTIGCLQWKDPFIALQVAGLVDHPIAREIVVRQVPLIVHTQRQDGGWRERSADVLRALVQHGLLDALRSRPPLPPDFAVGHSFPAPDGRLLTLASGDGRLWTLDRAANEAVAVSPDDGSVSARLPLPPDVRGLGWCQGMLAVTQEDAGQAMWERNPEARRLLLLDPQTGQLRESIPLPDLHHIYGVAQTDGRVLVADGFLNSVGVVPLDEPQRQRLRCLAGPGAIDLAAEGEAVWHCDWMLGNCLLKTGPDGEALDWGTLPFDGPGGGWEDEMSVLGLAHDGERLWALDAARRRICVVERLCPP